METPPTIHAIHLCPGYRQPMRPVGEADAVAGTGLRGDAHARAGSERQVLLIEKETLDLLRLSPGEVKENITTDGIALMALTPGTQLRLGESVLLEVTKPCSPCSRMEEIRPGLFTAIRGKRGILATVIRGGTIRRGDPIRRGGGSGGGSEETTGRVAP